MRRILLIIAVAGWAGLAKLATHQSHSPVVFGRYSPEYSMFLAAIAVFVIAVTIFAFRAGRGTDGWGIRNLWRAGALVLSATIVSLLLAEVLVRSFDLLGASFFREVTQYILELEADETLVYKHKANASTVYQGVAFRTNEIGLRDRPLPKSDVPKVLFLGDSVTLGWGVAEEKVFATQVEQSLTNKTGQPVRTINSGVSGYNTVQELAFLRRYVDIIEPDILILVYVENDVETQAQHIADAQERWNNPPGASAWLLRWSWLYRLVYFIGPDLIRPPGENGDRTGWEDSMNALQAIAEEAGQRRIPLVTFLFRMTPDPHTDELREDIRKIATDGNFEFSDMLPWFHDVHIRTVVNSFVDTHANAKGHKIIADGIVEALEQHGLVKCLTAGTCTTAN